jgi:hypothetical protein
MTGSSVETLRRFFERAPVARRATRPLSRDARVNLSLPEGAACFTMEGGAPAVVAGASPDPDFTLTLPEAAVGRLTALEGDDVGELGIAFFKLVLERDPAAKVRVKLHASTGRLLENGYLGVLAQGGLKVSLWLIRKGFRNPRAAIERLRGR